MTGTQISDMTPDATFPDDAYVPVISESLNPNGNYKQLLTARLNLLTGTTLATGNFGTFTGTIISNNSSAKTALQELETATELRPTSATLAASGGSDLVGFIQSGTGAVATTSQEKSRRIVSAFDFLSEANKAAAIAETITEAVGTAAVQAALNSIGVSGHVHIEDGVKFTLTSLTFPLKTSMSYRVDDDQSVTPGTNLASGERVNFLATSSYNAITNPFGGIVNETRFTAPYHSAIINDTRKDVPGGDSGLGPGQSRTDVIRGTISIADEQIERVRVFYENNKAYSSYSGAFFQGWRFPARLNGIGTAAWSSVPSVGTVVTGTTSGAKGHVREVAAGYTELQWYSGVFQIGETVSDNNETTSATITSVVQTYSQTNWLGLDLWTGGFTIGDAPVGVGTETLNISGAARIGPTYGTSGVISPRTVTNPALFWGKIETDAQNHQLGIEYRVADKTDARRRLNAVDTDKSTWLGEICSVQAACTFGDSAIVDTNAVNIASITNSSTGRYDIVYTRSVKRGYGHPSLSFIGTGGAGYSAVMEFPATSGCSLFVYNTSNALADIPASTFLALVLTGSDIV